MSAEPAEEPRAGVSALDPDLRADLVLAALGDPADVTTLLASTEGRRALTAVHPLIFALTYLPKHISNDEGEISFADMHVDVCELAAREWTKPVGPKTCRDVVVAPRECGKSTWLFLILPLWAAAHGYSKFVAAFSDTSSQAQRHLTTFKRELDENELLRADYPELCTPAKRPGGTTVSDRQDRYISKGGFAFSAMGIDGPAHGLKEGAQRPDLIILDDIEGGVGNYTLYEAGKRLETLQGSIFYLNLAARVLIAGTVTLAGAVIHQLVQQKESWVAAENLRVHYYPALYRDEAGEQRSVWPAKWPVRWLNEERDTNRREFARNMQNQPVPKDSEYWHDRDFTYRRLAQTSTVVLSIDPAVTTKKKSDETAFAVVAFSAAERKAEVREVFGVRLKGELLRQRVLDVLARHPDIGLVIWEQNQGGTTLPEVVLHDLPCRWIPVAQKEPKEIRAERLLSRYRRGHVVHSERLHELEQQMMEFPKGLHDDMVDAVGTAVDYLASAGRSRFSVASR